MIIMSSILKKIPYVNLKNQWETEREDLLPIIDKALSSGKYVGGEEVEIFEENIAKFCDVKYSVALNSGTDALMFALMLSGVRKGDEVITPPNSFVASTSTILHVGAKPVFVDVLPDQNIDPSKIEEAITKKTKAIMPVHLTGRMCDMDPIMEIAERHNLIVIEDAAQAFGSKYKGKSSGSIGDIGCFSTHPLKNLNACGDGGFVTTNNEKIYNQLKILRNQGMSDRNIVKNFGTVSRMDTLQAAILNYRFGKIEYVTNKRRLNAKTYFEGINQEKVFIPKEQTYEYNTYHTFVLQTSYRDELKDFLLSNGIGSAIHYPIPIHLQLASKKLGYKIGDFPITEKQSKQILTLPINQSLSRGDLERVISQINHF
jgi:dTDP-4-amino-4,6-dideoxygalactose transaminase